MSFTANETVILASTAASIAAIHTVLGPDHYIPFVSLARARKWSPSRTLLVTFICGVVHVFGSVGLGLIGVAFAISVVNLEAIEAFRGDFAAWVLLIFGLCYFAWGMHHARHGKLHSHKHHAESKKEYSSWALYLIFLFGPCEPLIPLLMYPAARNNLFDLTVTTAIFSLVTVATMLVTVAILLWCVSRIRIGVLEQYGHALSGFAILLCGIAILFFEV